MARNQDEWLDYYKKILSIRTDYQLAKKLKTTSSRISQLRRDRQRLTLAECITIADTLHIDVLEILTSIEIHRVKRHEYEIIKQAYFDSMMKTISDRMNLQCSGSYYGNNRR